MPDGTIKISAAAGFSPSVARSARQPRLRCPPKPKGKGFGEPHEYVGSEIFCSLPLAKFRPLPLLFARFFRHRRRSQTSPFTQGSPKSVQANRAPLCKGSWHGAAVTEGLYPAAAVIQSVPQAHHTSYFFTITYYLTPPRLIGSAFSPAAAGAPASRPSGRTPDSRSSGCIFRGQWRLFCR